MPTNQPTSKPTSQPTNQLLFRGTQLNPESQCPGQSKITQYIKTKQNKKNMKMWSILYRKKKNLKEADSKDDSEVRISRQGF